MGEALGREPSDLVLLTVCMYYPRQTVLDNRQQRHRVAKDFGDNGTGVPREIGTGGPGLRVRLGCWRWLVRVGAAYNKFARSRRWVRVHRLVVRLCKAGLAWTSLCERSVWLWRMPVIVAEGFLPLLRRHAVYASECSEGHWEWMCRVCWAVEGRLAGSTEVEC